MPLLPDFSWRAHLLLLGVLRPGAGNFQSGGRSTCRPAPFPGAGGTSLTEADAGCGIRL
ncbi:hypothetical protein CBM2615_A250006 [Cupriavidus taiwanensis]|uniref:Uncharacterized protein n=1 Tax=Cupriavidus taiwanensis TaxID=164546 RepID=A0A976G1X3_9BURK|nr:hypothetical protein CBM2615_A250006 [Cupriavidus taiwanensis]SOZ55220.1 hypothetical protein CBM2614_A220006 [Cupriavidus taiwanensis]SOZ57811.1 hypothetical protein CBM2613_A230006 [Cupriavidus taiwanensis]SPA05037.1 hypothetical protein CBM2625_A180006 [Cupriavidus taiwanensis]